MYAVTITESSYCWKIFRIDWTFDFHHFMCLCMEYFFFSSLCTVIPSQLNCAGNQLSFIICLQLVAVCLITLNVLYTLSGKTKNTNCIIQFKCSTISNPIQINWHVSKRHTHYTPQQKKNNNNNISGCMIWYKMLDIRNWQLFFSYKFHQFKRQRSDLLRVHW